MARPLEIECAEPQLEVRCLDQTGWAVPPGWYGFVEAAGTGIVRRAGIDQELGLSALERLGKPEAESRSPEFDGRRLVRVNGGYLVLNFAKYREKDYTAAERAKRYRENKKRHAVTPLRHAVTTRSVTQAEAEAEAYKERESTRADAPRAQKPRFEKPSIKEVRLLAAKSGLPEHEADKFHAHYESNGWRVGRNPMQSWHKALAGWKLRWQEGSYGNGKGAPAPTLMDKMIDAI